MDNVGRSSDKAGIQAIATIIIVFVMVFLAVFIMETEEKRQFMATLKEGFENQEIRLVEDEEALIAKKVTYEDGKEIESEIVSSITKESAKDDIVAVKTVQPTSAVIVSRGGNVTRTFVETNDTVPTEYEEVIEAKATAYCLCKKCCGKDESNPEYGVTRSGLKIEPGTGMKVIAVDPKVIPLGSKVYVEGLNGVASYGYAVAADTGSAIKENKIDLYMDSHDATIQWGIKNVKVYVLSTD